jgi:DNA-binding GntR family transcriptional regulator
MCAPEIKILSETYPYDSLSRLVSRYLREKIIKIELKPGEKLNISQLASSLNVSRTTIREALTFLIEMSLVVQHSSSKFSVAELNTYQMFDMYSAREIIEIKAGILLCESITDEQLNHLEYLARDFDNSLKSKNYIQASEADKEFHRLIVEYCNNTYIKSMYNSIYSTNRAIYFIFISSAKHN